MRVLRIFGFLALALHGADIPSGIVGPFEIKGAFVPATSVDKPVLAALRKKGIEPAHLCSDAVFLRRVYVDAIGVLPQSEEVGAFLASKRADKRARLIEDLLKRDEFNDYWTLKWCDLLRVKAEFPINLWPNGVQAYYRWIREAVKSDMPLDRFARELLTSSGSNFRVPQVNFYRALQGHEPRAIAEAVALTFLGSRIGDWAEDRRTGFERLFSRVAYKGTAEWKEEVVFLDPGATGVLKARFPDGETVSVPVGKDPRRIFADWLLAKEKPVFARCLANRIWFWVFGRGVVHPPDDFRLDNPPANPELLATLTTELVKSDYDLRAVLRLILNSRTYQQSPIPRSEHAEGVALFASYPVRQLDAEVLIDALDRLGGTRQHYTSAIPEPFTFVPPHHRTIALSDGSITSQFLEKFGRPSRDSGRADERSHQPTDAQRLFMLNSADIQKRLRESQRLRRLVRGAKGNPKEVARRFYRAILSRDPTMSEQKTAVAHLRKPGRKIAQRAEDLAWALMNTKEFLYRH